MLFFILLARKSCLVIFAFCQAEVKFCVLCSFNLTQSEERMEMSLCISICIPTGREKHNEMHICLVVAD